MATKPYVSVVIPTYNHAKLLKKALDSVLAQTFQDWEAIVINNFSTDNTIEVVDSFADRRIKIFNFSNSGVIAASRNHGLREATGDFIAFWIQTTFGTQTSFKNVLSTPLRVINSFAMANFGSTVI